MKKLKEKRIISDVESILLLYIFTWKSKLSKKAIQGLKNIIEVLRMKYDSL